MPLRHSFEKHPEIFEQEFWYLFEHEFDDPYWFAHHDSVSYNENKRFNITFLEFVESGLIDRSRLLDATLKTLEFSYTDHEMRWYSDLHRRLEPTLDEMQARERRYLHLLDNKNPSTVALAFEMLAKLDKGNRLDDRLFLEHISPVFNEKPKSRPKAAVGIIARIVKRDKSLRNEAVRVALLALSHEAVDVQTAAVKLILQLDDPTNADIRTEIGTLLPSLGSSVQVLLAPLLTQTVEAANVAIKDSVTITPRSFGSLDVPRLETAKRLPSVQTLDELIDLAVRVVERPSNIDEIERLYDGISRLHLQRGDDFERKTSAIRKSLLTGKLPHKPYTDYSFGKYVSVLIGSWLASSLSIELDKRLVSLRFGDSNWVCKINDKLHTETYFGLLQLFLAHRISQGIAVQPLSTATHSGGWIDPIILVERIMQDPNRLERHDFFDKSLSLYRLAPDGRSEALRILNDYLPNDPYVNAVRAILGAEFVIVTDSYFAIAVKTDRNIRRREPIFQVDLRTNTISDTNLALPDQRLEPSRIPCFYLTSIFRRLPHYECPWVRAMLQWRSNFCPAIREPFFWHSVWILEQEIENMYDYSGPNAFLEPLLDPNEPVTETSATAMLVGLVAKPESLAMLAQDVLIASIGDGRLNASTLSVALSYWIRNNLPKRVRWLKRFQTVAAQSIGHTGVLCEALENIVSDIPSKESGGFLELLYELSVSINRPIASERCRRFLETFTGSSKGAKLAKKLLALYTANE